MEYYAEGGACLSKERQSETRQTNLMGHAEGCACLSEERQSEIRQTDRMEHAEGHACLSEKRQSDVWQTVWMGHAEGCACLSAERQSEIRFFPLTSMLTSFLSCRNAKGDIHTTFVIAHAGGATEGAKVPSQRRHCCRHCRVSGEQTTAPTDIIAPRRFRCRLHLMKRIGSLACRTFGSCLGVGFDATCNKIFNDYREIQDSEFMFNMANAVDVTPDQIFFRCCLHPKKVRAVGNVSSS